MSQHADNPSQESETPSSEPDSTVVSTERISTWQQMKTTEDWWAVWCGGVILLVAFLAVLIGGADGEGKFSSPFKPYLAKPGKWVQNPIDAFYVSANGETSAVTTYIGVAGVFVIIGIVFTLAMKLRGKDWRGFAKAFPMVFLLATFAYVLAGQSVIKAYNLEYALWALLVGLIISNTVGTPEGWRPAILTEFFIKTGLVLLGAGVLMSRLMELGIPGVGVAWVVTPIVLVSTYIFGQKVLKVPSKSLNMVISADMSVCGVSAAIATAASCKAKKEELSLAIGLSLSFTVVMMVILPILISMLGLSPEVGGAWLGGTIDATGAVAVAGATLGDEALDVAVTVKMIQNILIGVTAFFVAIYWVSVVEKNPDQPRPGLGEIWYRFPKFVLGFVAASIFFTIVHATVPDGDAMVTAMVKGSTKTLRGWLFCLAFVCIGLETNFKALLPFFRGGKPMWLYVCGQSLNLVLTLIMAYLMFGVLFPGGQ